MTAKSNYRELVWEIAKTDFKLRYDGSVLGYLWSLLKPFLLFLVMWIVFSLFIRWQVPNYQSYLLLGILIWNFFVEGTTLGSRSLTLKVGIIKKIYFPRILIVIASTLTAFFSFLINMCIFFAFNSISGIALSSYVFLFILTIPILYILVLGMSLFLSAVHIKLRDIDQIWEVFLQLGFWLTPIVYPLSVVPGHYQFYLYLNPLTGFIQNSRALLIDASMPTAISVLYLLICAILIFVSGYLIFMKISPYAAEEL